MKIGIKDERESKEIILLVETKRRKIKHRAETIKSVEKIEKNNTQKSETQNF